ncbi:CocE/NonD family hydrolase [Leucobacter sp. NPDC058333]|uniref:CocE/NonD family hydrolase n=1 Tax=Leucobacter sp. NPDC058333 TaxID=3346450 RepID=UPI0036586EBA
MVETVEPETHRARTSGGVQLGGLLWHVADAAGIVILRTPYDAQQHTAIGTSWATRGYHCLIQDVRGRYRSAGDWHPYQHEAVDGASTIADLRARFPALPIVMFGASYAADAALEAARGTVLGGHDAPDAIIALVPALGLAETAWAADGSPLLEHRIAWWHEHGSARRSRSPLPPEELACRVKQATQLGVTAAARTWDWPVPVIERWNQLWSAAHIDVRSHYCSVTSPLLVITGADDHFDADAHRLAGDWSGPSQLVTGPWGHRLAADLQSEAARNRLRATGGIGSIIDEWLRRRNDAHAHRRRTVYDPRRGVWHREEHAA